MTECSRDRPPVDGIADERIALRQWLDFHRALLIAKCEGLSSEQLRARPVATSSLSLHGLVRHMTDVEQYWFRNCVGAEDAPSLFWREDRRDADFDEIASAAWDTDLAAWHAEVDRSRSIEADEPSLDRVVSRHGRDDGNVRWVMVHMIEEYARHNGHADIIRELVDGATGDGWDS